jgi:hypothetical protein
MLARIAAIDLILPIFNMCRPSARRVRKNRAQLAVARMRASEKVIELHAPVYVGNIIFNEAISSRRIDRRRNHPVRLAPL